MNNRILFVFLLFLILFSACSFSEPTQSILQSTSSQLVTETNGYTIQEGTGYKIIDSNTLPVSISYNGVPITLSNVTAYEMINNYDYIFFSVVELDISNLSDEAQHWLTTGDMSIEVRVTNEKNNLRSAYMDRLGKLINNGKLYYVFHTNIIQNFRYSFSGSELFVSLRVTQEMTHEFMGKQTNDFEKITYSAILGESLSSPETIDRPLYDYVVKWIKEKANN